MIPGGEIALSQDKPRSGLVHIEFNSMFAGLYRCVIIACEGIDERKGNKRQMMSVV
jgi:hypothetical protein